MTNKAAEAARYADGISPIVGNCDTCGDSYSHMQIAEAYKAGHDRAFKGVDFERIAKALGELAKEESSFSICKLRNAVSDELYFFLPKPPH